MKLVFRAEFFREGGFYVGIVPELDVSSFGESLEEARASLKEAVEAFLEEVLQEAGFKHDGHLWSARSPLATEILSVG